MECSHNRISESNIQTKLTRICIQNELPPNEAGTKAVELEVHSGNRGRECVGDENCGDGDVVVAEGGLWWGARGKEEPESYVSISQFH